MLPLTVRTHEGFGGGERGGERKREACAAPPEGTGEPNSCTVAGRRRRHRAMPRDRGHEQMGWAYVPEEGKIG